MLQGAAYRWRQNGWVSTASPVSNVDLWVQLLTLLESSNTVFQCIKIASHVGLHGNDVADDLANRGRLMSPLYQSARCRPPPAPVEMAIGTPTPPRRVVRTPNENAVPPYASQQVRNESVHTPLGTPARNLFTPVRAGPLMDEDPDSPVLGRGPLALPYSDENARSSDDCMSLSRSRSPPRSSGTHSTDSTTISQACSSQSSDVKSVDCVEACRQLGPLPMVQPAKRRRRRSYSPSTEASCGTVDSGNRSDCSIFSL